MVLKAKIHSVVVLFMERWFFSLQDPIFLVFSGFFKGLFELDLLL